MEFVQIEQIDIENIVFPALFFYFHIGGGGGTVEKIFPEILFFGRSPRAVLQLHCALQTDHAFKVAGLEKELEKINSRINPLMKKKFIIKPFK